MNRARRDVAAGSATVTDIASRRVARDFIESITLVYDGVHYGTFSVRMPFAQAAPVVLYVVPSEHDADDPRTSQAFSALITNDPSLGIASDVASAAP